MEVRACAMVEVEFEVVADQGSAVEAGDAEDGEAGERRRIAQRLLAVH